MQSFSAEFSTGIRFNEFIEHTPLAIAHVSNDGVILEANQAFKTLVAPLTVQHLREALSPEDAERFTHLLQEAAATCRADNPAVSLLPISLTLALDGNPKSVYTYISAMFSETSGPVLVVHMIDQTEQKNLEMRFSHSQKMQAVGQLAGGVAHDFNNLLTAMIGFCDLLLMRHPAGDPSFADIMQIKQNANRAANLVRQLLAFSRKQTLQPKTLDVSDVLAEISNLIRRLIGENIHMNLVHGRNLGSIRVDQGQLEQVLINLAVNARDAMTGGGTLTIRTGNVTVNSGQRLPANMIAPSDDDVISAGDYVLVEIEDTGTGIPPEIIKNIFEPFYSTKEVGSGTGLGLSTCYGIIKQTGGFIYVSSQQGTGTTFHLYFKRVEADRSEETSAEAHSEAANADLTGQATIMLVEDETPVRIFAARALRNKGYQVLEADSGETALEAFAKNADKIDLIISDVVMPGMNGPNMLLQLEKNYAERMAHIQVVFISGYAEDAFADSFGADREFHFLPKPFTLKQLAGKVKDVLGGQAAAA